MDIQELDLVDRLVRARRKDPELMKPLQSRYPQPPLIDWSKWRDIPAPMGPITGTLGDFDPRSTHMQGVFRGLTDIAGMPMDLAEMASNIPGTGAWAFKKAKNYLTQPSLSDLIVGEQPTPTPMTSDWIANKLGISEPKPDADLLTKLQYNIPRFATGFAAGGPLAKTKYLKAVPGVQTMLGGDVAQLTKMGVLSGAGATIGEEYGGTPGMVAGALATPMLPGMAKGMLPLLTNQAGAVSMSPSSISQAWQRTGGSKIMGLGDKLGKMEIPGISRQSRFGRWMGGNTFDEWFLPPQERMKDTAANAFRDAQAEAERTAEALRTSVFKAGDLNMADREALREVLKYNFNLSKAPVASQAKIAQMLQPVIDSKAITKQKLYPTAAKEARAKQTLDEGLMKIFAEDVQDPLWQIHKQTVGTKYDLTTQKGTLDYLDDVLKDPAVDSKVKTIARDYYDILPKTAEEVAYAHRKVYDNLLSSELKTDPDLVVPKTQLMQAQINHDLPEIERLTKNFVEIPGNQKFDGLLVERNVAEGLRDLETHVTNFRRNWNKYFLNPWKFMKIGLNVPARLRDLYSNVMFNDIYGKFPLSPFRVDVYGGALNDLRKASKGQMPPELERYFYYSGGKIDALNSVATDPIFAAMRHDANPLDNMLGMLYGNPVSKFSSNLMRNVDLWSKYAKFKHNLANGLPEREAIFDAMRSTGNMQEQSRAIRNVRDTAMPFFGWTAHALKTIMHGAINHPVRLAKWYLAPMLAGQYAVSQLGMSNDEWQSYKESLPEYMKDEVMGVPTHIPMPWRDEKGRIQMMDIAWWTPGLQDLSELSASSDNPMKFMQNPAFTLGASLLMNKKFSGAPIHYEWDDESVKWAKRLGYTMQQLMPPLTPLVGNQSQKIWEAFKDEDPNAPTMAQALGTQVGWRITPYEPQQQFEKNQKRLQAWENEAKHQMSEELGKTQDPAEQEKITEYYLGVMERLEKEKQGVSE